VRTINKVLGAAQVAYSIPNCKVKNEIFVTNHKDAKDTKEEEGTCLNLPSVYSVNTNDLGLLYSYVDLTALVIIY
jgi:hypothetical protein